MRSRILLLALPFALAERGIEVIRGVNLGGWLVLERWIVPSLMESCMVVPPDVNPNCFWGEVPMDEWTYCSKLREMGASDGRGDSLLSQRLHAHWDSWVTLEDVTKLAQAGVTHLRVPFGFWIMGDIQDDEPYMNGELHYLLRLLGWARSLGLEVWLDLHAAPGSQNGFDNSGHLGALRWDKNVTNVERTVRVASRLAQAVRANGYDDVVTGFGALNEPGPFVPIPLLQNFYEDCYAAVRAHLPHAQVYIGDGFNSLNFNDFWTGTPQAQDPRKRIDSLYVATYPVLSAPNQLTSSEASDTGGEAGSPGPWNGTDDAAAVKVETTSSSSGRVGSASTAKAYEVSGLIDGPRGMILAARAAYWEVWNVVLDTHIYQCFTRSMRLFTPKEHIYEVCYGDHAWMERCCYGANDTGSSLRRVVGEWTVAYDQAPGLALEGRGPRPMTPERIAFLRSFAEAQLVMYEEPGLQTAAAGNQSFVGWFYWNFKMESKTYEEWSYLSGLDYGWMPELPRGKTASELFGSCADVAEATVDDLSVVDTFPPDSWFADDATPSPPQQPPTAPPSTAWWAVGGVAAGLIALSALFWGCWCKTVKDHQWCEPSSSSSSASQPAYTQVGYGSVEMPPMHDTTRATTPQGL